MSTSSEKPKSAQKGTEPPSTIELEAVSVNVDRCVRGGGGGGAGGIGHHGAGEGIGGLGTLSECDSDLGPPSELLLEGSDSADSLKNEKAVKQQGSKSGCWARYEFFFLAIVVAW